MQQTWGNQRLDTQEQIQAFRQCYAQPVYEKAFALTNNADRAKELTEQVFALMQTRFEHRGLPQNSLVYMKAQLTLMHDRAFAVVVTEKQEIVTPELYVVAGEQPGQQIASGQARRRRQTQAVNEKEAAQASMAAKPEADAATVQGAEAVQPETVQAPDSAVQAAVPEQEVAEKAAVYNEQLTAMWTPGQQFDLEELEAQKEVAEAIPDEKPSEKRSVWLSIINTALVLVLIVAIAFVLAEFGVFPRLF